MSAKNHPIIELTETELKAFPMGSSKSDTIIPSVIERALEANPDGITEIKLPLSLTGSAYRDNPPTILVNENSTGVDIYERLTLGHQDIGPEPMSLVDAAREIKNKFGTIIGKAQTIQGSVATKLVEMLQEFQDNPNVTKKDCVSLVEKLDELSHSGEMPHFSASDYLKKGTDARPELDTIIERESLRRLISSAEFTMTENLRALGISVLPGREIQNSAEMSRQDINSQKEAEASYRENPIPHDEAVANYLGIVEEVKRKFEVDLQSERMKDVLMDAASTVPTLQSAKRLAYLVGRQCDAYYNINGTEAEIAAIKEGKGAELLAQTELEN